MDSRKLTNILLLALVALLAMHLLVSVLWPVGRYVRYGSSSQEFSLLDTRKGRLYLAGKGGAGQPEFVVIDLVDKIKQKSISPKQ